LTARPEANPRPVMPSSLTLMGRNRTTCARENQARPTR
jgi:hypothetical protein